MRIDDKPMSHCGMVLASGFYKHLKEDFPAIFSHIDKHQRNFKRNCAVLTLMETQHAAIREAEKNGFKKVFSFYNPNSGYHSDIYVKTLWANEKEFEEDKNKTDKQTGHHREPAYEVHCRTNEKGVKEPKIIFTYQEVQNDAL